MTWFMEQLDRFKYSFGRGEIEFSASMSDLKNGAIRVPYTII
jgi:hypothetical protein